MGARIPELLPVPFGRPAAPEPRERPCCPHCGVDAAALIERAYQAAQDEIERQIDIVLSRRFPR